MKRLVIHCAALVFCWLGEVAWADDAPHNVVFSSLTACGR